MTEQLVTPAKMVAEKFYITFPFENFLAPGEVLYACTCECIVLSGVDADPSAVLSGSTVLGSTSAQQLVADGVAGVVYLITARASKRTGVDPYDPGPELFVIQTKLAIIDYVL